jgi:hypothetical protein
VRYVDGLATTLATAAVPYGFTLVIWSTGSLLPHFHGKPSVAAILLFITGAGVAYGLLRTLAAHGDVQSVRGIAQRGVLEGGAIHVAGITLAVGLAYVIARFLGFAAWPLAPFVATFVYLGGTAVNEGREIVAAERGNR